ncbi:MAG TPA: 3-dehydroquinate synthase [Anaerolineales bacterium]|nr:3-dehydroquinate synthase [Anaerolineales bacterium]
MKHIFLYGPPGAGKSSVGQVLAERLRWPFVDLDLEIERSAGQAIPQIVEQQGEAGFRNLETETLERAVNESPRVIALGGGALLRHENRMLAENNGKIILLMAEPTTLLERLQSNDRKRPLLAGDLRSRLSALLEMRREHYASFPLRIPVDGKSAQQKARQAQMAAGRHHLSAMGEYDVVMDDVSSLKDFSMENPLIVTDENVAKFHAQPVLDGLSASGLYPKLLTVRAGESYKTLDTVIQLWRGFVEAGLERKSTVIALGGGVIGDLAGFAASTFMRGIDWVGVPTTLLAMVDSSLGGKTGFDLPEGKNLIGSFYPPRFVLIDPHLLETLPGAEFISGMAEVLKYGIISDPELFALCGHGLDWIKANLEEVVQRAVAVKVAIIEEDPYEQGLRASLNLGHTVGHAVELVSHFQLRHGEAVAIGMAAEAKLAERLKVATQGLSEVVAGALSALGLPSEIPRGLPRDELIRAMQMDKKRSKGVVRFALPVEIGRVELLDVTDLESVLEDG